MQKYDVETTVTMTDTSTIEANTPDEAQSIATDGMVEFLKEELSNDYDNYEVRVTSQAVETDVD